MRRGCIAVGNVECDSCHRSIKYGEQYLMIDEEGDEAKRLCDDCCHSRGYVSYRTDKGKRVSSFFPKG